MYRVEKAADELRHVQHQLDKMAGRRLIYPFKEEEAAEYILLCERETWLLIEHGGTYGA